MKVRMKTCLVGSDFTVMPGGIFDCDTEEAVRLIEADLADPIKDTAYETATVSAPETGEAAKPGRKKRA